MLARYNGGLFVTSNAAVALPVFTSGFRQRTCLYVVLFGLTMGRVRICVRGQGGSAMCILVLCSWTGRRAVGRPVSVIDDLLLWFCIILCCVFRRRLAAALQIRVLGTNRLRTILLW